MSNRIPDAITAFFAPRLHAGDHVCVALSGGRDSVVLLHALRQFTESSPLSFSLSALHVHHGLSQSADNWAEFCTSFCRQLDVPLSISRVEVSRDSGEGIEGAARRARHAVFSACKANWLVLGHHRDDQAETVLLHLLRGAGIAGVAGMPDERRSPDDPLFVRPLLDIPRSVIEAYANDKTLAWIDDESNEDVRFRRNFLRHEVLPKLETCFPGTRESLSRAARHFGEAATLLDELAAMDYAALLNEKGRILQAGFMALSLPRARNLLRFIWKKTGFLAPDARWIDEAIKQITTASAETCVSTAEGELHVYRGELYVFAHPEKAPASPIICSLECEEMLWAGGIIRLISAKGTGISRELIKKNTFIFNVLQGGERYRPDPKRPRKSLQKLFQETGVPPWERRRLPSLWFDGRLVWVGGLGIDTAFSCKPDEEGIVPSWFPGGTLSQK